VHTVVRRFIKTSIAFLAVGLLIGGWMMARRELFNAAPSEYLVSAHTHALFVGFVMELILGMALWLFPRPAKEDQRYSARAVTASYWILTLSTSGRIAGELARTAVNSVPLRWFVLLCGLGQIAGLLLFFNAMWSRVRPVGSKVREERGERF
jgi:heme/copper-type cytochrome/quinol oxidase subunit 1